MSRRTIIRLVVLALASGAVVGRFVPANVGVLAIVTGVLVGIKWRLGMVITVMLALGVFRGWLAIPSETDQPARSNGVPFLIQMRAWCEAKADRVLPHDEAALLKGILLGSRSSLSSQVRDDFRTTGTSHIVAVSGYNVTIVVAAIAAMTVFLPLSQSLRSAVTLAGVAAFVIMTGASAAVVRAGIMGSLVVVARMAGRLSDPMHALSLAAGAMVVIQPEVAASIGFQLSVAATAGLVLLSEPLAERLRFVPEKFGIRQTLASTLAAIAFTEPIILLAFGQFSVIAPVVNVFVLPFVPISMLLGFVVTIMTGLLPPFVPLLGWIAWLPLQVILAGVHQSARLPFAAVIFPEVVAWCLSAGLAGAVFYLVVRWRRI